MTDVSQRFAETIRRAKENKLTEIDFSIEFPSPDEEKLTSLPVDVFELDQLEVLNLSGHNVTALPEAVGDLRKLKKLDLSFSRLENIPPEIGKLKKLLTLNIWG